MANLEVEFELIRDRVRVIKIVSSVKTEKERVAVKHIVKGAIIALDVCLYNGEWVSKDSLNTFFAGIDDYISDWVEDNGEYCMENNGFTFRISISESCE